LILTNNCVGCYGGYPKHYFIAEYGNRIVYTKIVKGEKYSVECLKINTRYLIEICDSIQSEKWNLPSNFLSHFDYDKFLIKNDSIDVQYTVKHFERPNNENSYRVKFIELMDSTFLSINDSLWIKKE
jgi:hypothetical protein